MREIGAGKQKLCAQCQGVHHFARGSICEDGGDANLLNMVDRFSNPSQICIKLSQGNERRASQAGNREEKTFTVASQIKMLLLTGGGGGEWSNPRRG